MTIKEHEKRFGLIAVGKGFITLEQLIEAIKTQVEEDVKGAGHRLIGEILVDMGAMDGPQVIDVLNAVDKRDPGTTGKSKLRN